MAESTGTGPGGQPASSHGLGRLSTEAGLSDFDLGASDEAPPAYGDLHDQLHLDQPGFSAGAAVTTDGRVNISINSEKNSQLARLLGPTLQNQLALNRDASFRSLPPPYIPPSLGGQPGQTPPPRLNVVIQIVGSRGDVQPFVALGQVLKDTYGHRVRLATHTTFKKFVEENGLEFFNIGGDPAELMAFMVKNPGLMPGIDALKSGEIKKRREGIEEILLGCWRSCIEAGDGMGPPPMQHKPDAPVDENYTLPGDPAHRPFVADAIIANPPSFAHIHVAEKLGIPLHMMFTMPWSPTRAFPHPLANIESSNTDTVMTNYLTYALVEMMTWQGLGDVINRFRLKMLDLDPLSLIWAPGLLNRLRIPATYCWSPALIPKPADWADEITVAGFYFLNLASSFTPEPDLAEFLAAGPPPVYIGFGSIVVDDPNSLTKTIFDAVTASGVRALVSKGWGGLGVDNVGKPDSVFMLGNVPHDWLFKHVAAVVHHGGAGTSAAGINAGKPTVVVPFFGDQPFWGAMIARAGAGPAPIPYAKLTAENLAAAITEAVKPQTQTRAEELGAKIREEKGADVGGKSFHEFLDTDKLRCSIAPSRVAVWRVRRTKLRLSSLAAAVLVEEEQIKYSDLKLYRPCEYQTEDQPWDPISAATSALVGDIGNLTMAVADFPREVFQAGKKRDRSRSDLVPPPEQPTANTSKDDEAASVMSGGIVPEGSTAQPPVEGSVQESRDVVPSTTSTHPDEEKADLQQESLSRASTAADLPTDATATPLSPPATVGATPEPMSRAATLSQTTSASSGSDKKSMGNPSRPGTKREDSAPLPVTFDTMMGAGRGAGRIVAAGMKTPMNFCMGVARGFRNAPKLYNDDTIRPTEKVTGIGSGLRVAGKEFGYGLFDGISGLVTQPIRGAQKEGGLGLVKGFGKGVGGIVLKPSAAIWSIPAYAMQGIHAQWRSLTSRSSTNYIITSRVVQGRLDMENSSAAERADILDRWLAKRDDLRGYYLLRQKQKRPSEHTEGGPTEDPSRDFEPQTGWMNTRNMSLDERRKLHAQREAWKRRQEDIKAGRVPPGSSAASLALEDEEFERAIQASVQQTSSGNAREDARVEAAIRASVLEMRRIAERARDFKQPIPEEPQGTPSASTVSASVPPSVTTRPSMEGDGAASIYTQASTEPEDDWSITEDEYQHLIEQAVMISLAQSAHGDLSSDDEDYRRAVEQSQLHVAGDSEEEEDYRQAIQQSQLHSHEPRTVEDERELQRAVEESRLHHQESHESDEEELRRAIEESTKTYGQPDHDEDLQRILEESEKSHREQLERERTEEDIVLEHIKKQSLAEEEYRRSKAKGKGVAESHDDSDNDEELKKALEESLKFSGRPGEGSGSGM